MPTQLQSETIEEDFDEEDIEEDPQEFSDGD